MSVTNDLEIRRRSVYNPLRIPTLPESIWYSNGAIIGDATGGHAELNVILNPGSRRSGRAWSLEQCFPTLNVSATERAIVRAENMDLFGPGLTNPVTKTFSIDMQGQPDAEVPESAGLMRDCQPHLFMGSQATTASPATVRLQTQNIDLNTFGVYCTGYEWGPEAVALGPQLPPGSLLR